jgi:hypothetical protein
MFSSYERLLGMDNFKENKNSETRKMIYMSICSQILLYYDSLREEYNKHFTIAKTKTPEEKAKVEQVKELLKPVFKKINEWKDIENFRNVVLAHNLRDRKNSLESVFMLKGLGGYDIPERHLDYRFLVRLTNAVREVVYQVFKEEYLEIDEKFNSDDSLRKKEKSIERDYDKEVKDLKDEMISIQKRIEARFN